MDKLTKLAGKYGTDKGSGDHYFTEVYEYFFHPIKHKARKICEIGIADGASLKMFRDYFPRAVIYGIDINDASGLDSNAIKTFIADQASRKDLKGFIDTYGYDFDIILDDGDHTMEQQQVSLGYLFKYLKGGGYYIIEDVHTSFYDGRFGVEKKQKNTTLAMINNFIRNGKIESKYMAKKEQTYLTANVNYCNLLSRNSGSSITCIFKKK